MSDEAIEADRRIIGVSSHDALIGRLLERTEGMLKQNEETRETLSTLNGTMTTFQGAISELRGAVHEMREGFAEYRNLARELEALKSDLKDVKKEVALWAGVRRKVVNYALIIAALAITAGTAGGQYLRKALGIEP